jgi:hypothetical protein
LDNKTEPAYGCAQVPNTERAQHRLSGAGGGKMNLPRTFFVDAIE